MIKPWIAFLLLITSTGFGQIENNFYPKAIFNGAYFIQQNAADQFGVVSKSGQEVVPFLYNRIQENDYGLTVFKINKTDGYERSYSIGYYNKRFQLILPVAYHALLPIDHGKIIASSNENRLFGIVDTTGKILIPFIYQEMYAPQEGLFLCKLNNRYGYITNKNQVEIDFQFSYAGNFSNGLATASTDKLIGYINKRGNFEIPMRFTSADEFENGFAQVFFNEHASTMNEKGIVLFPFVFSKITALPDSLFVFEAPNEYRENFEERLQSISIPTNLEESQQQDLITNEYSGDESYSENYYFTGLLHADGSLIGGNNFTQIIYLGTYSGELIFAVQAIQGEEPNYNFALMNGLGKMLTEYRFLDVHHDNNGSVFLEEESENETKVFTLSKQGKLVELK